MNMRNTAVGAGLVIAASIATAALIAPRQVTAAPPETLPRIITVSGTGEASVKPDMASISTGVTSEGATARAALSKNNAAMTAVLKALRDAGVEADDIQTSNFSISPLYAPMEPGQAASPRISGYQVSNQVTAKVKDIARLGATLDALVQAGSNQVNGISFDIKDPASATNDARRKAIADARARAELYAKAAGASVGTVMQISEVSVTPIMPVRYAMAERASAAAVPIAPGQNTLSASVTVTFELR